MTLSTNVARRQGSRRYYARLAVPKDLQNRMRKRELWKSLGTTDPKEAKRLARPILDQWEREFAEVRKPRILTEAELQDAVWSRYLELLTEDDRFRLSLPNDEDLDEIWRHLEGEFGDYDLNAYRILETIRDQFQTVQAERTARFAKLKGDTARGETQLVADIVRDVIAARRLELEKSSEGYRKLAQGLLRVISTTAVDSKDNISIQFCDVLAGLTTRHFSSGTEGADRKFMNDVIAAGLSELTYNGIRPSTVFPDRIPPKRLTGPDIVDQMTAIIFGPHNNGSQ